MIKKKDCFVFYYNEFKHKIYAYFLYRVGFDQKLAEDLTSEVFLKAFKNFEDFEDGKPFQPWIFTISRNHLINHYKASKRETSLTEMEGFLKCADHDFESKHELARVMGIISDMEEKDKEVLLLRFSSGLSNTEIADLLEKEEGAIRTRISRSLSKLRRILNKQHAG
ncbi:MAG: RNA polymerase sigma factor [bacterium]|nr:RNA polymerase sigma factor [bacterium]